MQHPLGHSLPVRKRLARNSSSGSHRLYSASGMAARSRFLGLRPTRASMSGPFSQASFCLWCILSSSRRGGGQAYVLRVAVRICRESHLQAFDTLPCLRPVRPRGGDESRLRSRAAANDREHRPSRWPRFGPDAFWGLRLASGARAGTAPRSACECASHRTGMRTVPGRPPEGNLRRPRRFWLCEVSTPAVQSLRSDALRELRAR